MRHSRARSEAFSLFAFQDIITSVTGVIVLVALLLAIELVQRSTVSAPPLADDLPTERILQLDQQIESLRAALQASDELVAQLASLPSSGFAQREADLKRTRDQLVKEVEQLEATIRDAENRNDMERVTEEISRLEDSIPTLQTKMAQLQTQLESLKKSHRVVYNPNPFDQKTAWLVDLSLEGIRVAKPGQSDLFIEFAGTNANAELPRFIDWAKQRNKGTEYFVLLLRPQAIRVYDAVHKELTELGFDTGVDLLETDAVVMGSIEGGS